MVSDFCFHAITVLCLLLPWLLLRVFEVCSSEEEETTTRTVDCCSKKKRGGGNFILYIVQEPCESRGGRPNEPSGFHGCKDLLTMLRHWSQPTSEDIKHHFIIYFIPFFFLGSNILKTKTICMYACVRVRTHTHMLT